MARNPAKQFNLGIHKIPSFRFHFYKKHTIPPKTRGFNPRCSRRFLSMAWPSSCFRQTSRWSLAMSKANRQDPQEVKLNHADLPPRKTKWWRDKGGILKGYGKAKVFAQREGRSCWKKMRDEFGGEDFVCACIWWRGVDKNPCQVGALFRFGLCFGVSIKLLCFHGVNRFFPSSKIQVWQFWERTSSKSFKQFHIIFHCSVSNLASVSPGEQPQTIIHRNRHVFFWDRIPTNPHPFSVGFLWRSGNFSGLMLSGTKMSKQMGHHRHRIFISIGNS